MRADNYHSDQHVTLCLLKAILYFPGLIAIAIKLIDEIEEQKLKNYRIELK